MTDLVITALLRRIARIRLAPTSPAPGVLPDSVWRCLVSAVEVEGLVAPLAMAVEDGVVPASPAQARAVADRHLELCLHSTYVDRLLLQVRPILEANGPFAVLKGVATSRLDHGDIGRRPYADVDVLVLGRSLPALVPALHEVGLQRVEPERRAGFDHRFAKDLPLRNSHGVELDLHRTLTDGRIGVGLDTRRLLAHTEDLVLAGQTMPAVDREVRYVHACLHALRKPPLRLGELREVAQIGIAGVDVGGMVHIAGPAAANGAVAWVTRIAQRVLGTQPTATSRWAARYEPTGADRRALRPHVRASDATPHLALASVSALSWRQRLAYLDAMLRPSSEFLAARQAGRSGWLVDAIRRT